MTRINTNVSSLSAQKNLSRSNDELQTALTRLSTGLRINSGKDDPAGLIASQILGAEIASTNTAISNTELANEIISTADSALAQISSLLEDIRSLVEEAANTGALSDEQIAANQLQVDSSLEAINRISQTTQFQGKNLLDGSLDYITENVDSTKLSNLSITSANFGTASQIGVDVQVATQATQAALTYRGTSLTTDVVLEIAGNGGTQTLSLGAGTTSSQIVSAVNQVSDSTGVTAALTNRVSETATEGQVTLLNSNGTDGLVLTSVGTGTYAGDFTVKYVAEAGTTSTTAAWSAGDPNVLEVSLETSDWVAATAVAGPITLTSGTSNGSFDLDADVAGAAYSGATITLVNNGTGADAVTDIYYDHEAKSIMISAGVSTTVQHIYDAINNKLGDLFTATNIANAGSTLALADIGESVALTENGEDGGVVEATLAEVKAAIELTASSKVTVAYVTGTTTTHVVDKIDYSGSIGDFNVGDDDDPNNRVQLTGTDTAANLAIQFVANGADQSFSIDYDLNTRTMGKSTALIQADGGGVLQVQSVNQGTAYDGITVSFVQDGTKESVEYDKELGTITVTADLAAVDLDGLAALIEESLGSEFTATVISGGTSAMSNGDNGVTRDGAIYDGVTVNLATDANGTVTTTAAEVISAINGSSLPDIGITATNVGDSDGSGTMDTGTVTLSQVGVTAVNQAAAGTTFTTNDDASITITAKTTGAAYENVKIVTAIDAESDAAMYASYSATDKVLTLHAYDATTSALALVNAINTGSGTSSAVKDLFTFALKTGETGGGNVTEDDIGWLGSDQTGVTYTGTSQGGTESQGNFDAGEVVGTSGVTFSASEYGASQYVSVDAISGSFTTYKTEGTTTTAAKRATGTDAVVRINGNTAVSDGLNIALTSASLSLEFRLASTLVAGNSFDFEITGGGAKFQLGSKVVSGQQVSVGIGSVSTTHLGGLGGYLYQLQSGQTASLTNDVVTAAAIVDQAIEQVATFRGRLGAFQKTTLDTNIATLEDTVEALTEAKSTITDADFAAESSNLTRAQILAQSGISVLSIANQRPQQVLSLLQG